MKSLIGSHQRFSQSQKSFSKGVLPQQKRPSANLCPRRAIWGSGSDFPDNQCSTCSGPFHIGDCDVLNLPALPGLIVANGALATTAQYPGHPDQGMAKAAQIISWIGIGLFVLLVLFYGGLFALVSPPRLNSQTKRTCCSSRPRSSILSNSESSEFFRIISALWNLALSSPSEDLSLAAFRLRRPTPPGIRKFIAIFTKVSAWSAMLRSGESIGLRPDEWRDYPAFPCVTKNWDHTGTRF